MRMMILAAALALAGCSMTLPVVGSLSDGSETFSGSATGYMDGGGNLEILGTKGTSCKGNFVYVNSREGAGTFNCIDGRTGPFTFVSTGKRGTGTGKLGDQVFTFTFG